MKKKYVVIIGLVLFATVIYFAINFFGSCLCLNPMDYNEVSLPVFSKPILSN